MFAVLAATFMFGAFCLTFALNTPPFLSPDEPQQFDRVMAAAHGNLLPDSGELMMSAGTLGAQGFYDKNNMVGPNPPKSWADYVPSLRTDRPSYNQLGGNSRAATAAANYMSQHPPLYYAVVGAGVWLLPSADDMHADALLMLIRLFNVLLVLPVPFLLYRASAALIGNSPIAYAAAFAPLLVPGLARSAGSINNDNLAILLGCAVLALCMVVAQGDRSLRTAAWLAGLCIAGSLVKGTVLTVLAIVPLAYGLSAIRSRSLPKRGTMLVLALGAAGAATWWIRNELAIGSFQPNGYGHDAAGLAGAMAPVRPPGVGVNYEYFADTVLRLFPGRFWGALGLLEPPSLPGFMVTVASVVMMIAALFAVIVLRHRRWQVLLALLAPTVALTVMLLNSLSHYQHSLAIAGVQGRYLYPGIFGLTLPMVLLGAALLGRLWKWIPVLVIGVGGLISGWAVYVSVQFYWLPRGRALVPSDWAQALHTAAGFAPFPAAVTGILLVLCAAALLGGATVAVLLTAQNRTAGTLRSALAASAVPHPSDAGGALAPPLQLTAR
ncbi:MAG: DUF2142 domain-containing protein [Nakamurella sp.]